MTTIFLVLTIIVSLVAFQNQKILSRLIFNPYAISNRKQWYRFFSSGLIHADYLHLAINMLVLYSFGATVEYFYSETFGERGAFFFVILYVSSLMFSLLPTYNSNRLNPAYNGLGASGAVSAVVFAFILFDPLRTLSLYFIIRLPAIIFGVLYLVYCYYMGKRGGDNINHSAHMWGAIYGFCYTALLKPSLIIDFFSKIISFNNAI